MSQDVKPSFLHMVPAATTPPTVGRAADVVAAEPALPRLRPAPHIAHAAGLRSERSRPNALTAAPPTRRHAIRAAPARGGLAARCGRDGPGRAVCREVPRRGAGGEGAGGRAHRRPPGDAPRPAR